MATFAHSLSTFRSIPSTSRLCSRCYQLELYRKTSRGPALSCASRAASTKVDADEVGTKTLTAARVKDLSDVGALRYPRSKQATSAALLDGSRFLSKYGHVTKDSPADPGMRVELRGRLHSVRRSGSKLAFLDIVSNGQHVQGICNLGKLGEDVIAQPDKFKNLVRLLKRGDHVSIIGRVIRSDTNQLSIEAIQLPELLAPALTPIPFQITDDDTKMSQRHLDMIITPEVRQRLLLRSKVIEQVRQYFSSTGHVEVQTPILAAQAGGAVARPFQTTATEFGPDKQLALRIAPELWLKRLIVGGMERVFEIGFCFRNEGIDQTHNPEFTSCEFYRAHADLNELIESTEQLVFHIAQAVQLNIQSEWTALPPVDAAIYGGQYEQVEFIPALEAALGFSLPDLTGEDALDILTRDLTSRSLLPATETHSSAPTSLSKLLDRLAGQYLESRPNNHNSSDTKPFFITHHPECMSPLAKSYRCPQTNQIVSARAELFIAGREIANMYEEENDPFAQRRKFEAQAREQQKRLDAADAAASASASAGTTVVAAGVNSHNGKAAAVVSVDEEDDPAPYVVDEGYLSVLEAGMPPTGGWGCGIDRLAMVFSGTKRISDVLPFGNLRNVVGLGSANRKE